MHTVCSFVARFSSLIVGWLSCFDRVIFKGHLPIRRPVAFEKFVDHHLKMRRCDRLKTTAPSGPNGWSRMATHFLSAISSLTPTIALTTYTIRTPLPTANPCFQTGRGLWPEGWVDPRTARRRVYFNSSARRHLTGPAGCTREVTELAKQRPPEGLRSWCAPRAVFAVIARRPYAMPISFVQL